MEQNLYRSDHSLGNTPLSNQKAGYSGTFSQWPDEYPVYSRDHLVSTSDRPHVLVVDDNAVVLKTVAAMFRKIGYRVCKAYGSAKALLYFGKTQYDLVFTDLEMKVLDGYQLARIIKKHSLRTKVVIMTGYYQAELVDLMSDGSADGWLYKPFCIEDLNAMLTTIGLPPEFITK